MVESKENNKFEQGVKGLSCYLYIVEVFYQSVGLDSSVDMK